MGGEGAIPNSGQWEKGVCGVRRDGVWDGVGGVRGFDAVISLLTADPEPVSSRETWIYQKCAPEKHQLNIQNCVSVCLCLRTLAFGWGGERGRLNSSD